MEPEVGSGHKHHKSTSQHRNKEWRETERGGRQRETNTAGFTVSLPVSLPGSEWHSACLGPFEFTPHINLVLRCLILEAFAFRRERDAFQLARNKHEKEIGRASCRERV